MIKQGQEWGMPAAPQGVESSTWDKELYERASRFVKIDFSGNRPIVTIYKKKSIIMNSPKMRNELYRNLKASLLGDIGRVLIEQYQQRYLEEEPAVIQKEEWEEAYSRMYEDAKELIRRIVTHQPLWGGVADKDMAVAEDLLIQLLDFQSDPALEALLKEAKSLIDRLQTTSDESQQVDLLKRLEEIYNEMQKTKAPIAEQFRGVIQLPTARGVKHEKYYLALDKKRRMQILEILLNQLYLNNPPTHSGKTGREVAENIIYIPIDPWRYLKEDGVPTSKDTGIENPNFGNYIDITAYPVNEMYRSRLKEILKNRLARIVKESILQNAALVTYEDEQGQTVPVSIVDTRKDAIIDLTKIKEEGRPTYIPVEELGKRRQKKETETGLLGKELGSSLKLLSKYAMSDIVYIDSNGGIYSSMGALLNANEPEFENALNKEMLADIDEQLVQELNEEEVEEFEALPLAAEIYSKIVKVAEEISEDTERNELLQIAESLKRRK